MSHLVENVTAEAKGLQQDADLDGPPADEKQGHHHLHHAGDSRPHRCSSLYLNLDLEKRRLGQGYERLRNAFGFAREGNFSNLVGTVDGIHSGSAHTLEHEGITGNNGKQGQEVDSHEAVNDEGSLEVGSGEHLAAVRLRAKPVSFLKTLVHSHRSGQK